MFYHLPYLTFYQIYKMHKKLLQISALHVWFCRYLMCTYLLVI